MKQSYEQRCVIIGASHAGVQAAVRVRRLGWQGGIELLGDENTLPYHRPPLSKDYLKGVKAMDGILLNPEATYKKAAIKLVLGERIERIDRDNRQVESVSGKVRSFDKLILAVGSQPRALPLPGTDLDGVCYLRQSADVDRIRSLAGKATRAVIIGGGYIGLETAASLRKLGLEVTVLEAMDRVLERVTCETMSRFFTRIHQEEGVDLRTAAQASAIVGDKSVRGVEIASGETIDAELVIIGIGVIPNTELAGQVGLAIDNGIAVDQFAQTSDTNIYAIGDCASFIHPRYERRIRLESVQNANDQALTAAKAICGSPVPYDAIPWFWSDQYDVKMQIAGLAQGADEIICRGDPDVGRCFSLFYLKNRKLLAVDAINNAQDYVHGKKLLGLESELDFERLADPNIPVLEATAAS